MFEPRTRPRSPIGFVAAIAAATLPLTSACAQGFAVVPPAQAATPVDAPAYSGPTYADWVDLVIAAPIVVDATIRSAARIKGAEAAGVAPGTVRHYIEADVVALVRGPGAIPPRIGYLYDAPVDARGRVTKLKKLRVLLFARPVAGIPGQVQLVTPSAQRPWTPTADSRLRGVIQELLAADAPPVVTGIGNAFHVAGSLPGEGETQIFLTTADSRPVSLSILRRPGEQPRWAVALSEIVDDSAAPPAPDTLLWYRLACTLPAELPGRSVASLAEADAEIARSDYRFVIAQLGACTRTDSATLP